MHVFLSMLLLLYNIRVLQARELLKDDLQDIGDAQTRSYFNEEELKTLDNLAFSFLHQPHDKLWPVVPQISQYYPLIFFHQRKAGGSSLRESLHEASQAVKMTSYIPCYDDIPCVNFAIDKNAVDRAVYGGHFSWGDQAMLALHHRAYRSYFTCFTNYRHPIDRIESCLYFRFPYMLQNLCLNDYPLPMFDFLLSQIDTYGNSCLNEPFRVLSGERDELVLDHLMDGETELFHDLPPPADPKLGKKQRRLLHDHTMHIFKSTLQHTLKCTPVFNELPESYSMLDYIYPSFEGQHAFEPEKKVRLGKKRDRCEPVTGIRRTMIEKRAALEVMLYETVYQKAHKHLKHVGLKTGLGLHPMLCKRREFVEKSFLSQEQQSTTLLLGRNSMRSVVFRSMLETLTSTFSGSLFKKDSPTIRKFLPQHQVCNRNMSFIFAQPQTVRIKIDPIASSSQGSDPVVLFTPIGSSPSASSSLRRVQEHDQEGHHLCHGHIDNFTQAMVVLKDPFYMTWEMYRLATAKQHLNMSDFQYAEDPALPLLYRSLRELVHQTKDNNSVTRLLDSNKELHRRHPNFASLRPNDKKEYEEKHMLLFDVGNYFLLFQGSNKSPHQMAADYSSMLSSSASASRSLMFVSMEAVISDAVKILISHQSGHEVQNSTSSFADGSQSSQESKVLQTVLQRLGKPEQINGNSALNDERVICALLNSRLVDRELAIYKEIYKFYSKHKNLFEAVQRLVKKYWLQDLQMHQTEHLHLMYSVTK